VWSSVLPSTWPPNLTRKVCRQRAGDDESDVLGAVAGVGRDAGGACGEELRGGDAGVVAAVCGWAGGER